MATPEEVEEAIHSLGETQAYAPTLNQFVGRTDYTAEDVVGADGTHSSWRAALEAAGYQPDKKTRRDAIIDDLQQVADGEVGPTKEQYRKQGVYSPTIVMEEFGRWNKGLSEAGLKTRHSTQKLSREELIAEIHRVDERVDTFDYNTFLEKSQYSKQPYHRVFGGVIDGFKEAGVDYTQQNEGDHDRETLREELVELGDRLGRQPEPGDLDMIDRYPAIYRKKFGSFENALDDAGFDVSEENLYDLPTAQEVIEDFRRVVAQLGDTPNRQEYNAHGQYDPRDYGPHFSNYTGLVRAAGFEPRKRGPEPQITAKQILADVMRVNDEIDGTATSTDYERRGEYSYKTLLDRFDGGWAEVKREAGLAEPTSS